MGFKAPLWVVILCSWALLGFTASDPGALAGKVDMYVSQGRSDEALALLDGIIAANPDNVDAYFRRAFVNLKLSRHDRAIADFSRIISIRPNAPDAYLSRGMVYSQLKDSDRAMADYQSACTLGDASGCSFAGQLQGRSKQ